MPIAYARRLTGMDRSRSGDRHLGISLAFVAGATNAGAFLSVQQYTSHMTGMVSSMADYLVLGEPRLALSALGAVVSFMSGAAASEILINYARQRQLKSQYALPLLLEAALLLLFGVIGAHLAKFQGFFVPGTVMLLCFIMGLQNAVVTKISRSEIRTTHVTGLITDIGIELGKFIYRNPKPEHPSLSVVADLDRLRLLCTLVFAFAMGGVLGAIGFQHMGYSTTVPLAVLLASIAIVPATDDIKDYLANIHSARSSSAPIHRGSDKARDTDPPP